MSSLTFIDSSRRLFYEGPCQLIPAGEIIMSDAKDINGAEGATAPKKRRETLRQTDRRKMALWKAGAELLHASPKG